MRWAVTTFALLGCLATGTAVAESLVLTGNIGGMGGMNRPKSTLHYVLVGPDGPSGKIELPMDRGAGMSDSTFHIESKPIEIAERHVGLLFGRVDSPGEPHLWIPVVEFTPKPGQHALVLPDLQALPTTLEALHASYPFHLQQPAIIDHANREIVLTALKMHIEEGRISSEQDWGVLFRYFHQNKGYLTRADDVTLKNVLDYMYSWYRGIQVEGNAASSVYPGFYVKFLNAVVGLEIGGRELPGGQKLRSYLTETLKQIYAENPHLRASSFNETLRELMAAKWYQECMTLAAAGIVRIADDLRMTPAMERLTRRVGRRANDTLQLFTGCAQRFYVDNTTFGWYRDLERGFDYVWHELDDASAVRDAYIGIFDVVDAAIPKLVDGRDADAAASADEERVIAYKGFFHDY